MGQLPHDVAPLRRHTARAPSNKESPVSLRRRFFALTYDRFMSKAERTGLGDLRAELIAKASGEVLEVGAGTGANIGRYGDAVTSLTLTEPDPSMFKRLQEHASSSNVPTTVLRAPAEDLPFEDGSFDTVVSTLVLCGVDDQPRAVRELRRVLRPNGRLLLLEHVRSQDEQWAHHQDRMNWLNRFVVCCDCNRPTEATVRAAGFTNLELSPFEMPGAPKFVRPGLVGVAVAPATT
jgi:ubiquinone/menaquinone biosynthesis C-methylase UbiE